MPTFQISFMRVDRDEQPTVVESCHRTVDWLVLPREGEGIELGSDCPVTGKSVGYDFDGFDAPQFFSLGIV